MILPLNAINDFAIKLQNIDNRTDLLWYVARELAGKFGLDNCAIYLVNLEQDKLHQEVAFAANKACHDEITNELEIPMGQGVIGNVAESMQSIIVGDLSINDRNISGIEPASSEICTPLIIDGEVFGVIDCVEPQQQQFRQEHLDTLTLIATMTSAKLKYIEETQQAKRGIDALPHTNDRLLNEIAELQEIEERLRQSECRFRDFAESGSDSFWEQDEQFRFTEVSAWRSIPSIVNHVGKLIGRTRWEVMGINPDENEYWQLHVEDLLARRSFRDFRYNVVDKNGKNYSFSVSGKPVYTKCGVFKGYRGTVSNISKLVQTQEANIRFLHALDHLSEGLALWDSEKKLVVCNDKLREMAGSVGASMQPGFALDEWSREHLLYGLIPEAIGREEAWIAERNAYFDNPDGPIEVLRNGRWFLLNLKKLPDGSTLHSITDIHDLKQIQQRFELATEGAGIGIWEASSDGRAAIWSGSCYTLVGSEPGVMHPSQENFFKTVHQDEKKSVQDLFTNSLKNGDKVDFECRIQHVSGAFIWVRFQGELIEIVGERSWFGTITNIDVKKRADTAKSEFVSTMNHELRTPLTAIHGALDLILAGVMGEFTPEMEQMLSICKINSNHLLLLINDILEIDKMDAGEFTYNVEPLTTEEILSAAVKANEPFAKEFKTALTILPDRKSFNVLADRTRIQRVFYNLISNAIKFSTEGSTVEISAQQDGDFGVFTVKDYGSGIAKEFEPKLFERFTQADSSATRRAGGTGLGLSISKTIVEGHCGTIDYETEIGVGTTFWFTVPLIVETPEQRHFPNLGTGVL